MKNTDRLKVVCVYKLVPQCPAAFPRIHSILSLVGRVGGLVHMLDSHMMNYTTGLQEVGILLLF